MNRKMPNRSKLSSRDASAGSVLSSFFVKTENSEYEGADIRVYPAQALIFKQDTPADSVYLIEQGVVKLVRVSSNGSPVIVGLRRQQWLMGAPAVLLDKPYSFTAVTVLPSILRSIPAKVFLKLATTNRQFSSRLHLLLCKEIFSHMQNVEAVCCMSAEDRVKRFLCELITDQVSHGSKRAG